MTCVPLSQPSRMRAAVYLERERLAVEERPVPELGPTEVLLEVSYCGVCGTDLHLVMEGWGRPGSIGGHEYSGRIVALGSEVGGWEIGETVVGGPEPGCGACAQCRARRPGLCDRRDSPGAGEFQGAFAEYMRVDASQLLRLPEGLDLREAALAEPVAVALHGITLSGVTAGQRTLVAGAGPIGALTVAALHARGVADVTVSEPRPLRRALAEKLGARRAVEPQTLDVPRMPFALVEEPFDVAFECSGSPDAFRAALAGLRRAGRLVIVGTGMERPRLDTNRVLLNELVVTGAYNYDENGFDAALELLASGRLPTELLIEREDVPLEGLQDAMRGLVEGRVGAKVLVAPRMGRSR
ncbi:MAG: alcohol dehydrogenase catalytic domain-containing protein [Myxococcota bacterium]|nr:alcohol dehydrogenase catalytic domain-containing protein [Myxococcota bacterium]